jgi:hypothetical protein
LGFQGQILPGLSSWQVHEHWLQVFLSLPTHNRQLVGLSSFAQLVQAVVMPNLHSWSQIILILMQLESASSNKVLL